MKNLKLIGLLIFFVFDCFNGYSQNPYSLFSNHLKDYYENQNPEKLFIHTDKNVYQAGEILWLKANLVNAQNHTPIDLSRLIYLEIFNSENALVFQAKVEMNQGMGQGSFEIPEKLETGNYLLRGYTRWMENSDPDYFFQKEIRIINVDKANSIKMVSASKFDIQFFPEGGNLVSGLESVVGVRVVNAKGMGVEYKGYILDEKKDTLCRFHPLKFGLGHFNFLPLNGHRYYAILKIPGNSDINQDLPQISVNGWVLRVIVDNPDQLKIRVQSNQKLPHESLYLVCQTRGILNEVREMELINGEGEIQLDKSKFPEGIAQITLFNTYYMPLAERLIFKKPKNTDYLTPNGLMNQYSSRQEVHFTLKLNNLKGVLNLPEISVSAHLDDSLNRNGEGSNIVSYLYLKSDLKGRIEDPEFYFHDTDISREAIDNLMLTQGWRRFKWLEVFQDIHKTNQYLPEMTGPILEGRILDPKDNRPLKNQMVYLSFPSTNFQFYPSKSDTNGNFRFLIKNLTGSHEMILQGPNSETDFNLEMENPFHNSRPGISLINWIPNFSDFNRVQNRNLAFTIQNGFWKDKTSKISHKNEGIGSYFGKADYHYDLDNYTRFPSLPEVVTEYVRFISLTRNDGKYKAMVSLPFFQKVYDHEPLYLIDGVPVFSLDTLMKVKASKIKSLDVITRRYYYGPLISDGILSFNTYQGDLNGYSLDPKASVSEYEGTLYERDFFSPIYSSTENKLSKIPDFRTTLYWNPRVKPEKNLDYSIRFFTSDLKGSFRIEFNGINKDGQPIHQEFPFTVKN